jgi:hypothetical protein
MKRKIQRTVCLGDSTISVSLSIQAHAKVHELVLDDEVKKRTISFLNGIRSWIEQEEAKLGGAPVLKAHDLT